MTLTDQQDKLLTALATDAYPYFDHAQSVFVGGERITGDQWPTLTSLSELGLVSFGVLYPLRPSGPITITDAGRDVLGSVS